MPTRVLEVNLVGAFLMLREAAREMTRRGGGSIVNVVSKTALVGIPTMGLYGASKGGLLSLSRAAAVELAGGGVRANAVAPGLTETPLARAWIESQPDPAAFERVLLQQIPLGKLTRAEDVAAAIAYLASDDSSSVTGACLSIDGGYTAA